MKKRSILIVALLLTKIAYAQECTQAIFDEADKNAGHFKSWENVYAYNKKYDKCIGSDTLESVSEGIVRILSDSWNQLPNLKRLIKKDERFERFVIDGINSTVLEDDLLKIHDLAKKQCPKNSSKLCKKIGNKAIKAYKEINEN